MTKIRYHPCEHSPYRPLRTPFLPSPLRAFPVNASIRGLFLLTFLITDPRYSYSDRVLVGMTPTCSCAFFLPVTSSGAEGVVERSLRLVEMTTIEIVQIDSIAELWYRCHSSYCCLRRCLYSRRSYHAYEHFPTLCHAYEGWVTTRV